VSIAPKPASAIAIAAFLMGVTDSFTTFFIFTFVFILPPQSRKTKKTFCFLRLEYDHIVVSLAEISQKRKLSTDFEKFQLTNVV
jgi:hypothetical protein